MRKRFFLSIWALVCSFILVDKNIVFSASAISVPPEARSTAAIAKAASEQLEEEDLNENYVAEAEKYAIDSEVQAINAEKDAFDTQRKLEEARGKIAELEAIKDATAKEAAEAYAYAEQLTAEAEKAFAAADTAYKEADRIEGDLQKQEAAFNSSVQQQMQKKDPAIDDEDEEQLERENGKKREIDDDLLRQEKEFKEMEAEKKKLEEARRVNIAMVEAPESSTFDWSRADAAHNRASQLGATAEALGRRSDEAWKISEEKTAIAEEAFENYENTKSEILDYQLMGKDYSTYAIDARNYAIQAQNDLDKLLIMQMNPPGSYFMSAGTRYYSWHGADGRKGHQFAQPLYFGHWTNKFSWGLFTYHVSSHNQSGGEKGHVNTFTDTVLFLSKRQELSKKFSIDYTLSINIPTGKSALNWPQRYARMNEDIFEVEQFGKGWQFTPGIAVNWKPFPRDTWTFATSYLYSKSYNPTSDIANDDIKPGAEWGKYIRYQHAGTKWQFVGELLSTAYGRSRISSGDSYTTESSWEYRLTLNHRLTKTQDLMFYYWPERQNRNDIPFSSSNSMVHFFGTMWSSKLDAKRTIRASLDIMYTDGARYDRIHNFYDALNNPQYMGVDVDGREKYTFGIGYDYAINSKSSFSIDLQYFRMKDGASTLNNPSRTYKGWNLFFLYNKTF